MAKRVIRYSCYAVILIVSGLIIRQNAWKIGIWRYQIDADRIRHVTVSPSGWEYYLHVPRGYTDQRRWPLLVYVHGTGGSGRDALHIWRPRADQEGFFYLAPTFPLTGYVHLSNGEDVALWAMIAEVQSAYAIDLGRVFVCGFSGGAQFAHRFAFKYPGRVCGVSAMSAGSYDSPPRSGQVPFAVSVGQADEERAAMALWFANELRRLGYPVWYETYPDVGHWMCDPAVDLTIRLFRAVAEPGENSMDAGGGNMRILYGKGIWPGRERKPPQANLATGAADAAPVAAVAHASTLAHAIDMARAIGARIIFFCTGREGAYFRDPTRRAVRQIVEAGLIPCGCPVVTCRDPDAEAEVAIQTMLDGYAGLVFDIAPSARGQSAGAARLGELMTQTELPQEVMFFSGPPNLSANPDIPYAEMSRFCRGGFMPQAYASFGWNPQYTLDVIAYREFRCWTQAQGIELPVYPVLRLYRDARGQEPLTIGEMRSWLDALARYRPTFFSIRSPSTIPQSVWPLLANIEMTPQGQIPPPGPALEGEYVTVLPGETISQLCARHACTKEQFWIWNVHLWYNQGKPYEPEQLEAGWVVRVR